MISVGYRQFAVFVDDDTVHTMSSICIAELSTTINHGRELRVQAKSVLEDIVRKISHKREARLNCLSSGNFLYDIRWNDTVVRDRISSTVKQSLEPSCLT